jgi:peptide/nickel transport system substrate-binding protein
MYDRYFGPGANLGVPAGYSSPTLQHLIVAGDEASSNSVRKADYSAFQANLTHNAVWVWLFTSYDYAVPAQNVHGFSFSPSLTASLQTLASTRVS